MPEKPIESLKQVEQCEAAQDIYECLEDCPFAGEIPSLSALLRDHELFCRARRWLSEPNNFQKMMERNEAKIDQVEVLVQAASGEAKHVVEEEVSPAQRVLAVQQYLQAGKSACAFSSRPTIVTNMPGVSESGFEADLFDTLGLFSQRQVPRDQFKSLVLVPPQEPKDHQQGLREAKIFFRKLARVYGQVLQKTVLAATASIEDQNNRVDAPIVAVNGKGEHPQSLFVIAQNSLYEEEFHHRYMPHACYVITYNNDLNRIRRSDDPKMQEALRMTVAKMRSFTLMQLFRKMGYPCDLYSRKEIMQEVFAWGQIEDAFQREKMTFESLRVVLTASEESFHTVARDLGEPESLKYPLPLLRRLFQQDPSLENLKVLWEAINKGITRKDVGGLYADPVLV